MWIFMTASNLIIFRSILFFNLVQGALSSPITSAVMLLQSRMSSVALSSSSIEWCSSTSVYQPRCPQDWTEQGLTSTRHTVVQFGDGGLTAASAMIVAAVRAHKTLSHKTKARPRRSKNVSRHPRHSRPRLHLWHPDPAVGIFLTSFLLLFLLSFRWLRDRSLSSFAVCISPLTRTLSLLS